MRPSLLPDPYTWGCYCSLTVCAFIHFYSFIIIVIIILTALARSNSRRRGHHYET